MGWVDNDEKKYESGHKNCMKMKEFFFSGVKKNHKLGGGYKLKCVVIN